MVWHQEDNMVVMKFTGGISYTGAASGSRAQLWLLDANTIIVDLVSKPFDELQPDTHFIGVAKKTTNGRFVTPWVYLMNPEGGEHIEGSVRINFYIAHLEEEMIRVIGTWDVDDGETKWNFDNHLPRLRDPE